MHPGGDLGAIFARARQGIIPSFVMHDVTVSPFPRISSIDPCEALLYELVHEYNLIIIPDSQPILEGKTARLSRPLYCFSAVPPVHVHIHMYSD